MWDTKPVPVGEKLLKTFRQVPACWAGKVVGRMFAEQKWLLGATCSWSQLCLKARECEDELQ